MEGSPLPQSLGTPSPSPSYGCNKPSEQKGGGKCKAKTKHTQQKSSKLAEKQASRRHQALEREFSRAQRQAQLDMNQMASSEMELPLGPPTSTQGVWSIPGMPAALGPPYTPAQQATSAPDDIPEPTSTPTTAGPRVPDIGDIFSDGRLEALLARVVDRALAQRSIHPDQEASTSTIPPHEVPRELSAPQEPASPGQSSMSGYSSPQEEEQPEITLSEDEELPPEPSTSGSLFNANLFLTILRKATVTAEMGADQFPQPQTTSGSTTRPIFVEKVATEHHVPCPPMFLKGIKKQWASPSSFPSVSGTDKRLFNTAKDLTETLEVPKVDEAWTPLVSQTAIAGDLLEALKADDKRWEQTFRKTHQSAAWAIKTATCASFFVRTTLLWLQQLQARVPIEDMRTHQDLAKMVAATEYAADATLQSTIFSSRSIASNLIARRMLWLKHWQADTKLKWRLATAPYAGNNLFGEALTPYLVENKDKRKVMGHLNKKSERRATPYFRKQPFRQQAATAAYQPPRTYFPRQDRPYDRPYDRPGFRARQQNQSKRPFRGAGRSYRKAK